MTGIATLSEGFPGTAPLVTIAIPTYNRAALVRQALRSAITQNYEHIEVIISDNASIDDTPEVIAEFTDTRIVALRQTSNIGLIENWNACLRVATGTYFILLSDDDLLLPTAIDALVASFHTASAPPSTSEVAFSYGISEIHSAHTLTAYFSPMAPKLESGDDFRLHLLRLKRANYPSATLFRTADLRSIGGYTDESGISTDINVSFKLSAKYPSVACTLTPTTVYRFHPQNLTSSLTIAAIAKSTRAVGTLALSLNSEPYRLSTIKRAANFYVASSLEQQILDRRYFKGLTSAKDACASFFEYKHEFFQTGARITAPKAVVKALLHRLFGWRSMRIKN